MKAGWCMQPGSRTPGCCGRGSGGPYKLLCRRCTPRHMPLGTRKASCTCSTSAPAAEKRHVLRPQAGSAAASALCTADDATQRSEASISIRHRSDTASAHDGLADVCQKANALADWKQQQQQQPVSPGDSSPASSASPAAVNGGDTVSSSVCSGSDGSDPAAALRRRSPFADAKSPFTAVAGIANPAVADAATTSSFRSGGGGGNGRSNAEAAHDVASAAASCFADNCISADQVCRPSATPSAGQPSL